jgi:hypothetical protein
MAAALATVMLMLTLTGVVGIYLILRGAYLCVWHRNSVEGVLLLTCGIFTCIMTAMLTQGVMP